MSSGREQQRKDIRPMQWQAIYHDVPNSEHIDRSKLKEFRLIKNDRPIFSCLFPGDGKKKLIFRRKDIKQVEKPSAVFRGMVERNVVIN
jgi:hypothetical protein